MQLTIPLILFQSKPWTDRSYNQVLLVYNLLCEQNEQNEAVMLEETKLRKPWKRLLEVLLLFQSLGVYILVNKRPVVLIKMNFPNEIFYNYQFSPTIQLDILISKDFCLKLMQWNYIYMTHWQYKSLEKKIILDISTQTYKIF